MEPSVYQPAPAGPDFAARGVVTSSEPGKIVFEPTGTNYMLHLKSESGNVTETYAGPMNTPVWLQVRMTGRKLLTVPSGGRFVAPIMGTPKTVQGRVVAVEGNTLILHAGCGIHVTLPQDDHAIDLNNGQIAVGTLVNVICMAGASYRLVNEKVAV